MQYTKLGRTGLDVSRLCLGCMSYGGGNSGFHQWSLGEEESRPFIRKALEAGINFFDTANRYSVGKSEEVLGRALNEFARREEVVIATKVFNRMRPGPNGAGLSRKNILFEIDESMRRLGTDLRPISFLNLGGRNITKATAIRRISPCGTTVLLSSVVRRRKVAGVSPPRRRAVKP